MTTAELKSLEKINILLLEDISPSAIMEFNRWGLKNIVQRKDSPAPDELKRLLPDFHVLGIRSRTQLTSEVLREVGKFSAIGCFCIGTNQVDTVAAKKLGIPVFNAPYSNTRSVAELAICHIISLMRQIPVKLKEMHAGTWSKSAANCYEMRGKILGIVGYGHIGKQLSALAESLGMNVIYYDVLPQLSLGNAKPVSSLTDLLRNSDVVSLHVPDDHATGNMIGKEQLKIMKKGSYLINLARGSIVQLDDLVDFLKSGHLSGAALDVFPIEPATKNGAFQNQLRGLPNVILTPHIAGSTEEAQSNIGQEVAAKLAVFLRTGSTVKAVNFVEINIPSALGRTRFIHIHQNVPGMLAKINDVFSNLDVNILGQHLQTDPDIGYAVIDAETMSDKQRSAIKYSLRKIEHTIRSYTIY